MYNHNGRGKLDGKLATGIVQGSHGVTGAIKIKSISGETGHLRRLKELTLVRGGETRKFPVETIIERGSNLVVKLSGLESPEVARNYSGWEVWVDRKHAARLKKGEFYLADILGCDLVRTGVVIGTVRDVFESSSRAFFEVKGEGGNMLIPLEEKFVGRIDINARTIELLFDWPE